MSRIEGRTRGSGSVDYNHKSAPPGSSGNRVIGGWDLAMDVAANYRLVRLVNLPGALNAGRRHQTPLSARLLQASF